MFWKKTKEKELNKEVTYPSIVFVNKPVSKKSSDIIGFDSQVKTLTNAIDDGATMIGIIADYGTGKSSMTELLCHSVKKSKYPKTIKINMWDSLSESKRLNNEQENVSNLTKSFLFQLANGYKTIFGRYINKILSRNYGNISFATNRVCGFFVSIFIAGLSYTLYKIAGMSNTGIMQYLPERCNVVAAFYKLFSPLFILFSIVALVLGIKNICIAYSHWKMPSRREIEINDVFDTYSLIVEKIKPKGKKKQVIFIDDLDRIDDKEIIIAFLKELYRFQDSLNEYREKFVFVISIKPECMLKSNDSAENENSSQVYSKVFDTILFLKPIHFDDYDSILLALIKGDKTKLDLLQKLIGENIGETLPESFKWIKKGSNLTLRDLKDRLNHAVAIMVSLKNKSYKDNSAAEFSACTAVAYLENQYPSDYYNLIKDEKSFAQFMKESYKIVNNITRGNDVSALVEKFQNCFQDAELSEDFISDFCDMVLKHVFNADFRMYFYTYPKESHIKTTEERDLCNYLLFSNHNYQTDSLDETVAKAYETGENKVVESVMKSLDTFPGIVLRNDQLFEEAIKVSLFKTYEVFCKELIEVTDSKKDFTSYWNRVARLHNDYRERFIQMCCEKVLSMSEEEIVETRYEMTTGFKENIMEIQAVFLDEDAPQITEEEINYINNQICAIELVQIDKIMESQVDYLLKLINSGNLCENQHTQNKAKEIVKYIAKELGSEDISDEILKFLKINKLLDEELFEVICDSNIELNEIVGYLNLFDANDFSMQYLKLTDSLGFNMGIKEQLVMVLVQNELFYTAILYFSNKDDFSTLNPYLSSTETILGVCEKITSKDSDSLIEFRKHCVFNQKNENYKKLFFDKYPNVSMMEYSMFEDNKEAIDSINCQNITSENRQDFIDLIYSKEYSVEDIIYLFEYLFDEKVNENCITDVIVRKDFLDELDFETVGVKKLSDAQRTHIYSIIKKDYSIINTEQAITFTKKFGCFIPEIEKMICDDEKKTQEYCDLICELDELTDKAYDWLENNYLIAPLSDRLCQQLYENKKYMDYIIANILRNGDMVIDENIPFDNYINIYKNVDEVFEVMSGHWDFLERMQSEAKLNDLDDKHIIPMFKVRQIARFFEFIFSVKDKDELKKQYLKSCGEFKTEEDSISFQKLICKQEHMELLGDYSLKHRIDHLLWSTNSAHKRVFTRKWNERWKKELDETYLL